MNIEQTHTLQLAGDDLVVTERTTIKLDETAKTMTEVIGKDLLALTITKQVYQKLTQNAQIVEVPVVATTSRPKPLDASSTPEERQEGRNILTRLYNTLDQRNKTAIKRLETLGIVAFTKRATGLIELVGEKVMVRTSPPAWIGQLVPRPIPFPVETLSGLISPRVASAILDAAPDSQVVIVNTEEDGIEAYIIPSIYYPVRGRRTA